MSMEGFIGRLVSAFDELGDSITLAVASIRHDDLNDCINDDTYTMTAEQMDEQEVVTTDPAQHAEALANDENGWQVAGRRRKNNPNKGDKSEEATATKTNVDVEVQSWAKPHLLPLPLIEELGICRTF